MKVANIEQHFRFSLFAIILLLLLFDNEIYFDCSVVLALVRCFCGSSSSYFFFLFVVEGCRVSVTGFRSVGFIPDQKKGAYHIGPTDQQRPFKFVVTIFVRVLTDLPYLAVLKKGSPE